jgi:hypothetical protein
MKLSLLVGLEMTLEDKPGVEWPIQVHISLDKCAEIMWILLRGSDLARLALKSARKKCKPLRGVATKWRWSCLNACIHCATMQLSDILQRKYK